MHVVFVAAECEPWAKTGGLGDVVDALARALGRIPGAVDAPIEVFLPRYRSISLESHGVPATLAVDVPDDRSGGGAIAVRIHSLPADGYVLRLVDYPGAFDRAGLYGDAEGDFPDNAWRFGLLSRAALATRRLEGRPPDVVSIHDWHACPVALHRDVAYRNDPVIGRAAIALTIHNLAYHGWTPRARVPDLGLGAAAGIGDGWGIDLLREGIRRAEVVNTVSPRYAAEVLHPAAGMGLDGDLRAAGDRFVGILNGLDQALWDPATDPAIARPYWASEMAGKEACRADLLRRLGMDATDPGPVVGVIGRLDPQKGFDLVAGALDGFADRGVRLVALGSGDAQLVAGVRAAGIAAPDRVALAERFDRDLARRIYAGADLFLMPSRFEPCGQGQMIAQRYGTPPIARRTGGLATTIFDADEHPERGTGFLFDDATPRALLRALDRALQARAERERWAALVGRGMAVDWAWETGSAPAYAALFRRAVALRRTLPSASD